MTKISKYCNLLFWQKLILWQIEKIILKNRFKIDNVQIFISGLPRSGTTLIYQYMAHRLKISYFTNGVGTYPLSPCVITYLQHKKYGRYKSDFKSYYGKVKGKVAPREAGSFWRRFFGLEDYKTFEDLTDVQIHNLRNIIACVQHIFGNAPFVNKNVKHLLRIDALSKVFDESYFIIVERNIEDVALSLLRSRYKMSKNPREWFSVKPLNYHDIKELDVHEQIAGQLISLKEKMEIDLSQIDKHRIQRISYEDFCRNPEKFVNRMKEKYNVEENKNAPKSFFETKKNFAETTEEKKLLEMIKNRVSQ